MRILFLSPRLCWPLITGARIREYHLARALARQGEVTYVSFIQPGFPTPAVADLSFFREVRLVPLSGRYSLTKIVRGMLGPRPLSLLNYTTPEMKAAVAQAAAGGRFDLVHVDSCHMAEYVPVLENLWGKPARVVYDWHNIESEIMGRFAANVRSVPKKIYSRLTAHRLAALERWILDTGFGHVVCSPREKEELLRIAPAARLAVIENGVDSEHFAPSTGLAAGARERLVFVGTLDYHANIDGVVWFAERIWPRIRERFPSWKLVLVGANPAPAVLDLRSQPNIEVTGTVDDVRPFYRDALAAIVPLRTGGGTRLKILEAMAAGIPVVSTSLGAEGLAITPGQDIDIADDESDWLPRLEALAAQPALWNERSAAGRTLVRTAYDWQMLGERLYAEYCGWLQSGQGKDG